MLNEMLGNELERRMDTLENAQRRAEYWKAEHLAANAEIEAMRSLARDAYDAWDHDRDAKVGKLLRAIMDDEFRAMYRPDLVVPNA